MTTPDISNTTVLPFADGDRVVPRWWGTLAPFRVGPEHGNYVPRLTMNFSEAQAIVNQTLETGAFEQALRSLMSQHPVRLMEHR